MGVRSGAEFVGGYSQAASVALVDVGSRVEGVDRPGPDLGPNQAKSSLTNVTWASGRPWRLSAPRKWVWLICESHPSHFKGQDLPSIRSLPRAQWAADHDSVPECGGSESECHATAGTGGQEDCQIFSLQRRASGLHKL